jgi:hypothetical protein
MDFSISATTKLTPKPFSISKKLKKPFLMNSKLNLTTKKPTNWQLLPSIIWHATTKRHQRLKWPSATSKRRFKLKSSK